MIDCIEPFNVLANDIITGLVNDGVNALSVPKKFTDYRPVNFLSAFNERLKPITKANTPIP